LGDSCTLHLHRQYPRKITRQSAGFCDMTDEAISGGNETAVDRGFPGIEEIPAAFCGLVPEGPMEVGLSCGVQPIGEIRVGNDLGDSERWDDKAFEERACIEVVLDESVGDDDVTYVDAGTDATGNTGE
jgi:hypothetical protein